MDERILSQEEVDALLAAVDRGEISETPGLDVAAPDKLVVRYNFRKPNRVSKDQVKMLQSIHETFSRLYTSSLTTLVRGLVEVEFQGVEQLSYGEALMGLGTPNCLAVFNMEPLKGGAVLDINAHILFLVIERLLGGSGILPASVREFTEVERVLVERVAVRAMVDLRQAWHHVGSFGFRVDHTETNPQFVQLTSANEVVVAVTLSVRIGDVSGPITIVYPHVLLEPIMAKLNSQRWFATPRAASDEEEAGLNQSVLRVGVTLRGVLAEFSLTVRDVLAMKPGDVISAGRPTGAPAIVELQGEPRFTASAGIANRRKALRLLSTIAKGEIIRDSALGPAKARIVNA